MSIKWTISFFCIYVLTFPNRGYCQYTISSIPEKLKENANVVLLEDQGDFIINSDRRATYKVHQVIAILNSKGRNYAYKVIGYDKLKSVRKIEGRVYSSDGKLIRKLKKGDIKDHSNISGFSIYDDDRVKIVDLQHIRYPYIISFDFEVEYKYLYSIPNWYVQSNEHVAVLKSSFKLSSPKEYKPRMKLVNSPSKITERNIGGMVQMEVKFTNISAIEFEPFGPTLEKIVPVVYAAPSKFNFEGYTGNMDSWKGLGLWQNELNRGRNDLSEPTLMEVNKITKNLNSREEKIKAVYEYVQNKTRYVSIQLGIGGFQPFLTSSVDELGYGDCKALSFYTQSLLKSIGINSYYTWVYGGKQPPNLYKDFPNDVFNHIILCVPNEQDTVWLECTSQTNPFGYLGSFTGDRDVMIVTESGGKIVHTIRYPKEENVQSSKANISLGSQVGTMELKLSLRGLQIEDKDMDEVVLQSTNDQKKWLYSYLEIPNINIEEFSFAQKKEKIPEIHVNVKLTSDKLISKSGNRVFIKPNLYNQFSGTPKKLARRMYDIVFRSAFIDKDSITYSVPHNYVPEFVPKPINIISPFGKYKATFTFIDNRLVYYREFEMNKGTYNKAQYEEFRQFLASVEVADKTKAVFKLN